MGIYNADQCDPANAESCFSELANYGMTYPALSFLGLQQTLFPIQLSANPLTELSSVVPDSGEAPLQEPTLGPCSRYTVLDLGHETYHQVLSAESSLTSS